MAKNKVVFNVKHGNLRTIAFDNGVQLSGTDLELEKILEVINKMGKILKKGVNK